MRLDRLDLLRYGPFEDRSLAFSPEAAVTLVYGPNEAGKSSALAALSDLLFGFPHSSPYAYRFEQSQLRLGGVVRADDRSLAFHRLKGRKATLRDPSDDRPLPEDALSPFLGVLSQAAFEQLFALDAARLRDGGETLLKDGGELGETLLAAGAALRDATLRQRALEEQAAELYNASRKNKNLPLYKIFDRYQEAQAALKDARVTPQGLDRARRALEEAQERLAAAGPAREQARAAASLAARAVKAAPLLRDLDAARAAHDAFGALAEIAPGRSALLRRALSAAEEADEAVAEARADQARQQELAAELPAPSAALAAADEIDALAEPLVRAENALADLPELRAALSRAEAERDALARRLGVAPAELAGQAASDADLAALAAMIEEGRALLSAAERGGKPLDEDANREADRLLTAIGAPGALQTELRTTTDRLREAIATRETRVAALAPFEGDAAALRAVSAPGAAEIQRFTQEFSALERAQDEAARDAEKRRQALEQIEERIAVETEAGAPPSREAVEAARAARDADWALIRAEKFEGRPVAEPVSPDRFERGMAAADHLADERARDAQRAHEIAALHRDRKKLEAQSAKAEQEDAARADRRKALGEAWRAAWTGLGRAPGAPAEMADWDERRQSALKVFKAETALREDRERLKSALATARDAIIALAALLGQPTPDASDEPSQATLDRLKRALEQGRAAAGAHAALEDWRERRARFSARFGLTDEAGDRAWLDAADAARDASRNAPRALESVEEAARRLSVAESRIGALETAVAAIADRLGAPDEPEGDAIAAARFWLRRLKLDRSRQTEQEKQAASLEAQATAVARAERAAQSARDALTAEADALGVPVEELPATADRLDAKDAALASLQDAEAALRHESGGRDEPALRAEIADRDDDALKAEAERREAEAQAAAEAYDTALREELEAKRALDELGKDRGAAAAARAAEAASAEATLIAEEWLALRARALLIAEAAKRYRDQTANPMLEHASAAFATLTDGAFSALDIAFDSEGREHLVGRRASGETVAPDGMSEGARDQLFLALRLAAIERWTESRAPAPFIGDDLFASFDDDRAAAGFRALADLGGKTQVLLFTHHRHLLEIGRATLGDRLEIRRLDQADN